MALLTRCKLPLPAYFYADEKHSHCLSEKVYLPTIVCGRVIWHLGYTNDKSAEAFEASYTQFQLGSIIILAACPDGWGAEGTFKEWLLTRTPEEVTRDVKKRDMFSLGAHGAYILARPIVQKQANVIIVTNSDLASQLWDSYVHAVTTIEEAMELAHKLCAVSEPTYLAIGSARRLIVGS